MNFIELFILAVGLSMDAFAVAISKGLSSKNPTFKDAFIVGGYFGGFQAAMPVIGYLLGSSFQDEIAAYDHWISFILLGLIGINMLKEALSPHSSNNPSTDLSFKSMLILSIATSIDALAVGVTFAFLQINIIYAVCIIGVCTMILSMTAFKLGSSLGDKYEAKAEFLGGIILIFIAFKILIQHLAAM